MADLQQHWPPAMVGCPSYSRPETLFGMLNPRVSGAWYQGVAKGLAEDQDLNETDWVAMDAHTIFNQSFATCRKWWPDHLDELACKPPVCTSLPKEWTSVVFVALNGGQPLALTPVRLAWSMQPNNVLRASLAQGESRKSGTCGGDDALCCCCREL